MVALTQENVHNSGPGQHSGAYEQGCRTPLLAYRTMVHAPIQGGGGGGTARTLFFSPQLIFKLTEGVQWFYCREKDQEGGPIIFQGGGGGGGGSKCLFL